MIPELTEAVAALRDRIGSPIDDWCDQVPVSMAELMADWHLRPSGEPALAGYGGICLPVQRLDGTPGMLKITRTSQTRDLENEVLARWNGRHAVRLMERDDLRHARLLQRLDGPSLADSVDPVTAMTVAGDLAAELGVRPPPGLPHLRDIAPQLARRLEDAPADRVQPLDVRAVLAAAATIRELGADQPDALLHGDLQGSNILRDREGEWAVIDPLGLVGEPAVEALTVLRDSWADLPTHRQPGRELRRRLDAFADAARTPRRRVVAWTHARCVRAVVDGVDDDQGLHAWVALELGRDRT